MDLILNLQTFEMSIHPIFTASSDHNQLTTNRGPRLKWPRGDLPVLKKGDLRNRNYSFES